jgi:hypothetical protein
MSAYPTAWRADSHLRLARPVLRRLGLLTLANALSQLGSQIGRAAVFSQQTAGGRYIEPPMPKTDKLVASTSAAINFVTFIGPALQSRPDVHVDTPALGRQLVRDCSPLSIPTLPLRNFSKTAGHATGTFFGCLDTAEISAAGPRLPVRLVCFHGEFRRITGRGVDAKKTRITLAGPRRRRVAVLPTV